MPLTCCAVRQTSTGRAAELTLMRASHLTVWPRYDKTAADEKLAADELRTLFRTKLAEFIKTLDERDEDILRNRILSETPLTLDDLGAKYGITKERTRQLEARIIKRLRDYIKKDVKDFDRLRI